MGIPVGVTKFVITWTYNDGPEIAEAGFWCVGTDFAADSDLSIACAKVATHWASHHLAIRPLYSPDTLESMISGYYYGDASGKATHTGAAPLDNTAGTGSDINPLQTACCMSLRTGYAGRQNRGRMYLPANGASLGADHTFNSGVLQAAVGGLAGFLTDVAADGGIGAPIVVSRVRGGYQTITSVQSDYRPDVQRRRANKQSTGGYFGVAVAS